MFSVVPHRGLGYCSHTLKGNMVEPEGSPPQQEVRLNTARRPSLERESLKVSSKSSPTLWVPEEWSINNRMEFICENNSDNKPTPANNSPGVVAKFLKVNLSKLQQRGRLERVPSIRLEMKPQGPYSREAKLASSSIFVTLAVAVTAPQQDLIGTQTPERKEGT